MTMNAKNPVAADCDGHGVQVLPKPCEYPGSHSEHSGPMRFAAHVMPLPPGQ